MWGRKNIETNEKLSQSKALMNCPACGQLKLKKVENPDGSFYWKCMHCLWESKTNKR
jgi:ribosomal protein L37AE/L43A